MKCSGERSQALRVATAPEGSSRRDFPVLEPFLPPSSSSSSDPQFWLLGSTGGDGSEVAMVDIPCWCWW